MSETITLESSVKMFGGSQNRYSHRSSSCQCDMQFSVFLPPQAESGPVPAVYWLSGLTCTDENFVTKAGAQRVAAMLGLAIVAPDTSPRGEGVPDDPDGGWDFGLGAGFYVNATQEPYAQHYNMYDYVVKELPQLIEANFPVIPDKKSIFGHSMGGHGALTIALKNPGMYQSVSAFAPISSPIQCPWGQKALGLYLGDDQAAWREYDTCELIAQASDHSLPLFVEQGGDDNFLVEQLKPELLEEACAATGRVLKLRRREGYDHSYYFIATFMEDHLRYHGVSLLT